MVLLERLAGRMIRGCFSARPFLDCLLALPPRARVEEEKGGIRERREEDRRRHKTHTHLRKDPRLLGFPSPPEHCSYELLQGGHGSRNQRDVRDAETQGALSVLPRAATP